MKYFKYANNALTESAKEDYSVAITDNEEFAQASGLKVHNEKIIFTKLEEFDKYAIFTVCFPSLDYDINREEKFKIVFDEKYLYLIGDSDYLLKLIARTNHSLKNKNNNHYNFLCNIIFSLTVEQYDMLEEYETALVKIEEDCINQNMKDVATRIIQIRKKLVELRSFYDQLSGAAIKLQDDLDVLSSSRNEKYLDFVIKRIERLYSHCQSIIEYANQVRELHHTQVESKQNRIMKFLTAITTIFLPINLIAAWYGMNFTNMPELTYKYGYLVVGIISVVLVAVFIFVFKKKKWF